MAESAAAPQGGGSSQMLMIMMLFMTMFIMFDPGLRTAVGNMAGFILGPLIGFNGQYPVATVMLAGVCMVTFSTLVRHYFIDWVSAAEKQTKMKDFNKTLRDARMSRNDAEVKRLMKKQAEMTKDTMASTFDQMKPMMFTMIFLIATFAYIGTFIGTLSNATLSVPWSANVNMNATLSSWTCCMFNNWIFLYMLISISMAQVVQRVLKWYTFSKKLKEMESGEGASSEARVSDEEPASDEALASDEESTTEEYLEIPEETSSDEAGENL